MVEYKDRLADAMAEASLSVQKLADQIATSYQTVKKVLDGKSASFSALNNSLAAQALNVSSDWLATGKGPRVPASTDWPFEEIDLSKLRALDLKSMLRLEGAILTAADQLGIDIKASSTKAHGKLYG